MLHAIAAAAATSFLLPSPVLSPMPSPMLSPIRYAASGRTASPSMQARRETMRIRLTGCLAGGVGVGLDPNNQVDFLRDDSPAAALLQIGDQITLWNNTPLVDPMTKEQLKLKDVVKPADEHIVTIERLLTELSEDSKMALTDKMLQRVQSAPEEPEMPMPPMPATPPTPAPTTPASNGAKAPSSPDDDASKPGWEKNNDDASKPEWEKNSWDAPPSW